MRILQSALRHGITKAEIEEVVAYGHPIELLPSLIGNARVMFVGWTYEANLIEVGLEYTHEEEEIVFHARKATKYYRNLAGYKKL